MNICSDAVERVIIICCDIAISIHINFSLATNSYVTFTTDIDYAITSYIDISIATNIDFSIPTNIDFAITFYSNITIAINIYLAITIYRNVTITVNVYFTITADNDISISTNIDISITSYDYFNIASLPIFWGIDSNFILVVLLLNWLCINDYIGFNIVNWCVLVYDSHFVIKS